MRGALLAATFVTLALAGIATDWATSVSPVAPAAPDALTAPPTLVPQLRGGIVSKDGTAVVWTPTPRPTPPGLPPWSWGPWQGKDQLTEFDMDALLEATGWPAEWRSEAKAIAWCESKYSPGAIGDGGNSLGLFQLGVSRPGWQGWFRYFGEDESQWADPVTNSRVALKTRQYLGRWGGTSGWTCAAVAGLY